MNEGQQAGRWKQRLHLLNGAGGGQSPGNSFAADVDLVAFNVSKSVSSMDMRNWLSQRGVIVRNCELLTTSQEGRSLSYRITVDPHDYERVTTDASVWPNQVGVRRYRQFTGPRNEQRNGENRGSYERANNYNENQEQGRYRGYQRYEDRRPGTGQQTRESRGYNGNVSSRSGRQY